MKIGLAPSATKPESLNYIERIANYLKARNVEVFIDDDCKQTFGLPLIDKNTHIDIMITMGGDGTLLYYREKYAHLPKLIYTAVNLGGLGFMADVRVDDIETYLQDLIEKKYTVEERLMIEGKSPDNQTFQAVNDFVIHRGANPSMIQLKVTINNDHFNTFLADGIILSTPTGSSAYSLACGGPLMHPKLKAFVLTTISGHTLTNRPFVIPEDSVINIEYITERDDQVDVTVDGVESYTLKKNESTEMRAAENRFYLINYLRHNHYHTVRLKLNWKGKSTV